MTASTNVADAVALAEVALDQADAADDYRGFQSHLAQIRKCIERSIDVPMTGSETERLSQALEALGWRRLVRGELQRDRFATTLSENR